MKHIKLHIILIVKTLVVTSVVLLLFTFDVLPWNVSKNNQINKLPTLIVKSGKYTLMKNLDYNNKIQNAVEIKADDVEIDLNGYTIEGPISSKDQNSGIFAQDRKGIHIHNGTIIGFAWGVRIINDSLNNDLDENTTQDVLIEKLSIKNSSYRGIRVAGNNATVRNNNISDINGTTLYGNSIGIYLQGNECKAYDNNINNIMPFGILEGVGIATLAPQNNCKIYNNNISNAVRPEFGRTFAFWSDPGNGNVNIYDNSVSNMTYAYLHGGSDDAITIYNNKFDKIDCSPKNLSNYYNHKPEHNYNEWSNESEKCSDSKENFFQGSIDGDGRAEYRLAVIYYKNNNNFGKSEDVNVRRYRLYMVEKVFDRAIKHGLTTNEQISAVFYRDNVLKNLQN